VSTGKRTDEIEALTAEGRDCLKRLGAELDSLQRASPRETWLRADKTKQPGPMARKLVDLSAWALKPQQLQGTMASLRNSVFEPRKV
jgi:hypothetical protein